MEIQISQMSRNLQIGAHRPVTSLDNVSEIFQRLDEMQSRNDAFLRDELARLSHKVDQLVQQNQQLQQFERNQELARKDGLQHNQQLPQFERYQELSRKYGLQQNQQLPQFERNQELARKDGLQQNQQLPQSERNQELVRRDGLQQNQQLPQFERNQEMVRTVLKWNQQLQQFEIKQGRIRTDWLPHNQQLPQFERHQERVIRDGLQQNQQLPQFVTDETLENERAVMQASMCGASSSVAKEEQLVNERAHLNNPTEAGQRYLLDIITDTQEAEMRDLSPPSEQSIEKTNLLIRYLKNNGGCSKKANLSLGTTDASSTGASSIAGSLKERYYNRGFSPELSSHRASSEEASSTEVSSKGASSKGASSKGASSKGASSKEASSKEASFKEASSKEASFKETSFK